MAVFLAPPWSTVLHWTGVAFLFLFIFVIAPNLTVAYSVYVAHLKRTKPTKWTRECSSNNPVQVAMYQEGMEWSRQNAAAKRDVHIVNEGYNLYGEFYDCGSEKTALLVSGRTEGLCYCYYFAPAYWESGYNILTIDQRAHGKSDGKYNTIGYEEHKDLLAWIEFLQRECHTQEVVFHGICIGSATSLYAAIHPKCPDAVIGLVAEGMYPTFAESFKNHMKEFHIPTVPGFSLVQACMKLHTGYTMSYGPIHTIPRMEKPLLMLHSKEDIYSLPSAAEVLYDTCVSEHKKLVWFEHGKHSQLRYTDKERYDAAIKDFLKELSERSREEQAFLQ